MLLGFFEQLRRYRVPVSLREFLDLLRLIRQRLIFADQKDFYFLARMALVKDEKFYDRFDRAFANYFDGIDSWEAILEADETMLMQEIRRQVKESKRLDEKTFDEMLGQYREVVSELRKRVDSDDQDNPAAFDQEGDEGDGEAGEEEGEGEGSGEEGERGEEGEGDDGEKGRGISEDGMEGERDQETDHHAGRAEKVWLDREFADYDPDVELGTRNLKMALRRLRRWVREAADLELDLPDTIRATASNGGLLDIRMVPERHNAVRVLMLFDVGGSMDPHVELCAQLFSAAGTEFKHLEFYYFHNFLYESVWRENRRRVEDKLPVWDLLRTYPRDYKVIFVGDADMARHEITERGGSVEAFNAEAGQVWMQRVQERFPAAVWLNPLPESRWKDSPSIQLVQRMMDGHMYFLGDAGLEAAMKYLAR